MIVLPFSAMLWALAHDPPVAPRLAGWIVAHPVAVVALTLALLFTRLLWVRGRRGEEEVRHAAGLVRMHAKPPPKDPNQGFRDG